MKRFVKKLVFWLQPRVDFEKKSDECPPNELLQASFSVQLQYTLEPVMH